MLQNLEILSIEWCNSVEEVCELHNENDAQIATLPCVRDLNLGKLPLMKHLWWNVGPYAYKSLQNLNSLHIYECDSLIHLFSSNAMKSLVQLQELKVRSCMMLKTIFSNEGEDGVIVLPELCSVKIDDLPELLTFSQGSTGLEFPSLDMIEIKSCPKMKVFVDSDVRQEGNHGIISRPLFNEKVALPNLQALYLNGLASLDGIWHTQLPDKSFSKLQVINVMNCGQLLDLGPLNMLPRLQMLEVIQVTNCASLEQIFTLKHPQIQKYISSVSLINLVDLVLENLPNLRQIWWDRTPNHTHRFPRLAAIEVESCDRLDCIFPASVARGVPQLQKLKVYSCMSVKAIVGNNGQDLDPNDMIFPQICSIELENLPNVVVFCTRMSVLRWLSLKELRIVSCSKMGSFVSTSSLHGEGSGGFIEENLSNNIQGFFTEKPLRIRLVPILCYRVKAMAIWTGQAGSEGNHGIISRPLFNEKVALPNLQALYLNGLASLDGIWHTQLPDKSFSKLQVINVMNCGQLLDLGPLNMLPRLQMLEVIQVTNCASLEQIFTLKHPQIQKYISSVSLINLVDLVLENLPNLRQIWWDRTPNHTHRFPRLAAIEVESCDRLDCIFPASVARGVPQLQKLKVYSCMSVKAIVGNNGQDLDPNDMIFPQICSIELENLPNVVVFCTRMSVLRWLSLKELRIVSCSKMGSFVSTSSLHGEGSGGFIEENLSNNIQGFFTEKPLRIRLVPILCYRVKAMAIWTGQAGSIVFPSLEKLRVDNLECVNALWHTDTIAESFCQLRVLEVRNCDNLLQLIPSSLLSRMHNLEELHVNQCRLLEKIAENLEEDLGEKVMLPKLHTVQLINLPKLASFFSGDRSFEWPNLERFALEDCPSKAQPISHLGHR
ncbi:NB-ARC domains-containing protein [Artemisia annua]|uniref:NB-ARC domains-containing protein n=1 Tax=Artemisia annua TaxID=35608 RepID=A0A2U1Q8J7_ARTAN|nr:NB-ARC domains-containing protein [Artemisia annua]